jgi:hypothetical protein
MNMRQQMRRRQHLEQQQGQQQLVLLVRLLRGYQMGLIALECLTSGLGGLAGMVKRVAGTVGSSKQQTLIRSVCRFWLGLLVATAAVTLLCMVE